jgi:hypothetical protein
MPQISESTLASWTGPASDAEQTRYDWTCGQIREALDKSAALAAWNFSVYPKGSYPNYTNVVADSDVDIAVELTGLQRYAFTHGAKGLTMKDFGISPYTGSYSLAQFKNEVEQALGAHFPAGAVKRGSKAIHIKELKRGLAADVVPCETHFEYVTSAGSRIRGTLLLNDSDPSQKLVNYPQQHLDRGVDKNKATSRRYKSVVRILKRLENKMVDEGLIKVVPSFLIESGVWNVPDQSLMVPDTWTLRVRAVLAHIFNETMSADCVGSDDWFEANGVKYLFHENQPWTWQQAHDFAGRAWDRIGFD